jgi:hypothetical protein
LRKLSSTSAEIAELSLVRLVFLNKKQPLERRRVDRLAASKRALVMLKSGLIVVSARRDREGNFFGFAVVTK